MPAPVDPPEKTADLHLAFDIGHSSIGWAVLKHDQPHPEILGTGVVTFPADDCLASKRRAYRRQRRHIRSTRQRIERMARLVHHVLADSPADSDRAFAGYLKGLYLDMTPEQRSAVDIQAKNNPFKPNPAPWLMAARTLSSDPVKARRKLSWPELWDVLRWYAHNRGYDGNRLWSRQGQGENDDEDLLDEAAAEDAEKVRNARALLSELKTQTMAETIAAQLRIGENARSTSSEYAYKTLDMAFPRRMVVNEVRTVLAACGHLHGVSEAFVEALCAEDHDGSGSSPWEGFGIPNLRLPSRFRGGLLFGQNVPRFDNRIIGFCPVTLARLPQLIADKNADELRRLFHFDWEKWLAEKPRPVLERGRFREETEAERAQRWAEKYAKKPLKHCREFLEFRFWEFLTNIRHRDSTDADGRPLSLEQKITLANTAGDTGGFSKAQFIAAVRELTGTEHDNLDTMLMNQDDVRSLMLDPALWFTHSNQKVAAFWESLGAGTQKSALGRWRDQRPMNLDWFLRRDPALLPILEKLHATASRKMKKNPPSFKAFLRSPLKPEYPSGRAPFSRRIMAEATRAYQSGPGSDPRENGGILDRAAMRKALESRRIESLTNNHLLRQRLRTLVGDPQPDNRSSSHRPLRGLLHDLVAEYAGGDRSRIGTCTIEVARDLQEFSGKTKKEIEQDLGIRLKNFGDIVSKLREAGIERPSAGLIRKARIADDMKWRCPYTDPKGLKPFDIWNLFHKKLDKDHIIPRSRRTSDSLDSLVITYPAVNRLKGNMTGLAFVKAFAGRTVEVAPGEIATIASVSEYEDFVKSLAPEARPTAFSGGAGHLDDKLRRWRRRQRLLIDNYEEKERDFTPGDLTVSSHLMRLADEQISAWMGWDAEKEPHRTPTIPGQVTAEIRKAWKVTGCLIPACPEVRDPDDPAGGAIREKKQIRSITHLHHAVDACVIGLASRLLPNQASQGRLWQWLANRKLPSKEAERIYYLVPDPNLLGVQDKSDGKGSARLFVNDLPARYKDQIVQALCEHRVVQQMPGDMSGAALEETTWGVTANPGEGGKLTLHQRGFEKKDNNPVTGARARKVKSCAENPTKLVGLSDGKLSRIGGVRVIAANYGVAIYDDETGLPPEIIPHHQVWKRLREVRDRNRGRPFRLIRNGQLIRVLTQPKKSEKNYLGVWRVCSIKNKPSGIFLDVVRPQRLKAVNNVSWAGNNVGLASLLTAGIEILSHLPASGIKSHEGAGE